MLTQRELQVILEAWRLIAMLRSSQLPKDLDSDLTVAVRALERAFSQATT